VTTTSQVPAVTDYLVATAQAWPSLDGVLVVDGPQTPVATQDMQQVLWIGANPAELTGTSAEADQNWPVMDSARTRDENGTITCAAQHWSGDTTIKTHRDGAAAIVAAVELMLRGTPRVGGPGDASMGGLVMWSGVAGPYEWYPRQVANGALMLTVFRITYRARLTTS